MKTACTLIAAVAAASLCSARAQEPSPEDVVGNEAAVERKSVQDVVDEYLTSKGLSEGENAKKDGSRFYVAVGYGVIQAPLDSRGYADFRVKIYDGFHSVLHMRIILFR